MKIDFWKVKRIWISCFIGNNQNHIINLFLVIFTCRKRLEIDRQFYYQQRAGPTNFLLILSKKFTMVYLKKKFLDFVIGGVFFASLVITSDKKPSKSNFYVFSDPILLISKKMLEKARLFSCQFPIIYWKSCS